MCVLINNINSKDYEYGIIIPLLNIKNSYGYEDDYDNSILD